MNQKETDCDSPASGACSRAAYSPSAQRKASAKADGAARNAKERIRNILSNGEF